MKIPRPNLTRQEWVSLISFLLILGVVIAFVAWASYQIKDIRNIIQNPPVTVKTIPTPGERGMDGVTTTIVETLPAPLPKEPKEPVNGTNGKDATDEQVAKAVENYMASHPVKDGTNGQDGKDGRTVFIRFNPVTLTEECKYLGDLLWQPIEECK